MSHSMWWIERTITRVLFSQSWPAPLEQTNTTVFCCKTELRATAARRRHCEQRSIFDFHHWHKSTKVGHLFERSDSGGTQHPIWLLWQTSLSPCDESRRRDHTHRLTTLLDWVCLEHRCAQTMEICALIDSPFAMFGLERGLQSLWLLCTLIAHIFHNCVGYRTANYMCSPLSAAGAMASFFFFFPFFLTWSLLTFFFLDWILSCVGTINI